MEKGRVIEILPDNYAKICLKRTEACAKCGVCFPTGEDMTVIAYNPDGARVSQWVSLGVEAKYFLTAALILYGLPLSALLIGIAAGYYAAVGLRYAPIAPVTGLVTGVIFTLAAYLCIKSLDKKIKKSLYAPVAHIENL